MAEHGNIGARIWRLRHITGLSQKQLGELCGVSETTISAYERGEFSPRFDVLENMASALNVSLFQLIDCRVEEPEVEPLTYEQLIEAIEHRRDETLRHYRSSVTREAYEADMSYALRLIHVSKFMGEHYEEGPADAD